MEKIENMADASTNDTNTTTIVPPPTIIKGKPVMNRPQTDKNTTADRITMHPRSGTVHRTTSESLRLGNGTTDPVIGQPQISPPAARPPMSKPTKTSSFQITSVTVGTRAMDNGEDSADDLDESHTDDNSRITDLENETPSFSEDTFSKEEVFFGQTALGSAPVIPTSAQYGLAIVAPDLVTGHPFGGPDVDGTGDGTVDGKKLDPIDGKDLHNRNERFKVVKIESTEPFKRGRWMCMDYLDHTTLQQQTPTASGTGTATIPPESKTTTLDSGVGMADGQLYINSDGLANDSPNKPMPPDMNIQNFVSHTMSQPGYSMSTTTSPGQSLLQSLPPPPIQSGYTVDGSIHSTTGATNVPPQPIHHIVGSDGSAPQPPNGLPVQQSHSMTSIPTGPTGATGPYVAGNQPGQPFYQSQISDGQTYHQTSAVTSQPSTATISPTVVQSTGQQMPVHSTMSNQPATVSGQIPTNIYPAPSQPQTLHTSIGHQPQMLSHVHDPTPPPATQQQQQPQPPQQMVGQSLPAANFISMNAQQPPHIPQSSAFHYQPTDGQPLSYGTGQSDDQFVGAANPYVPLQTTGTTVPNNGGQPFVITSTTDIVSPASQIASQIRGQMPQLFQQQQSVQDAMGDGAVAQLATPGDGEQRTAEDSENMDDPSTNRSHYDKNKSVRKRATPPSPIVQQFPAATFINLSPSRDVYTTLALGGTVHAAHQSIGDDPSIGIPIPQGRFSAAHQRMYSPPVSPTYAASPPYGRYLSVSLGSEPEGMRSRVQSPTPWTLTGGRQSPRGSISETR